MPAGQSNAADRYGIYRRARAWEVAIIRNGQRHRRNFHDAFYGGEATALAWAQQWRDQILALHPPPSRIERAQRPTRSSGAMPGVTFECDADGRVKLWRAKTHLAPGQVAQKTFSVRRWGDQAEAFARAERLKQLEAMKGLRHVHPAESALRAQALAQPARPIPRPLPLQAAAAHANNSSGVPGVVLRHGRNGRSYWTAQTFHGGRLMTRSFPVRELGHEVALLLAIMERLDQVGAIPER